MAGHSCRRKLRQEGNTGILVLGIDFIYEKQGLESKVTVVLEPFSSRREQTDRLYTGQAEAVRPLGVVVPS